MAPEKKGDEDGWARTLRDVAPFLGLGTSLAMSVLLCLGGGYWLDRRLGTAPLFLLVGGGFGLFAGLYSFFKHAMPRKP
jgi:F0F1-type ATP synthase assembly protein I